jgi:prepilin-type processing-associated H-X9-DG protein
MQCASNLRQIGQAMQMYANENKGKLSRAVYDRTAASPAVFTNPTAPDPFGPGGPGPNDVTAAWFLLLRTQDVTSEVFLCPMSTETVRWDFGGKPQNRVSNFPGPQHLGYSFANPYASPAAVAAGFKWDYTLTSDFALAADMNPGPPAVLDVTPQSSRKETAAANSRNHNGEGQNVLYADGHVEFQNTPFCGMQRNGPPAYRDNVYTYGAGFGPGAPNTGVLGAPADALDSVLLPSAPGGAVLPEPPLLEPPFLPERPLTYVLTGLAAVILLCVAATIRLAWRPKRVAPQ